MGRRKTKRPRRATPSSIPQAVVNRLSLYLRELEGALQAGHQTTSSRALGQALGFTDAQVRKDLAYFGQFGYPGIGYRCEELIEAIRRILGTDRQWAVAMVGAGNLGRALLGYRGFERQGFRIVAAFDVDRDKVGTSIEDVLVSDLAELPTIVRTHKIRLGLIAVPAAVAQSVADLLVAAGVEGILNFAPVTIKLPSSVSLVGVDLAIEIEQLSFSVVNRYGTKNSDG